MAKFKDESPLFGLCWVVEGFLGIFGEVLEEFGLIFND
jgi:hypothetical protein